LYCSEHHDRQDAAAGPRPRRLTADRLAASAPPFFLPRSRRDELSGLFEGGVKDAKAHVLRWPARSTRQTVPWGSATFPCLIFRPLKGHVGSYRSFRGHHLHRFFVGNEIVSSSAHQLNRACDAVVLDAVEHRPIGVVIFNGFALQEMADLVEAFQLANALAEHAGEHTTPYQVVLLSASGGRVASDTSMFVWTECVSAYARPIEFHAVFLVNGSGLQSALRDARLAGWFAQTCSNGERLFASARSHQWLRAAGFRGSARHAPPTELRTSAGFSTDRLFVAALRLIETDHGAAIGGCVANRITRRIESPSPAIQSQPAVRGVSEKIQASKRWLESNCGAPITMRDLAQAAAMSERTFLRRFKLETGLTPSEYLLRVRFSAVCQLLVQSDLPIETIARQCGLGNSARLAKLFRTRLGVTPSEYRRKHIAEPHMHICDTPSAIASLSSPWQDRVSSCAPRSHAQSHSNKT
jgi:transcriptional regulator GlxA family with amidase domain